MLNCRQAAELMSQRQDRRLTRWERFGLRLHLWVCQGCRQFERQLAFLRAACGAWMRHKD